MDDEVDHTDFQTDQMAARLAWMLDIGTMVAVSYCVIFGSASLQRHEGWWFGDQVITAARLCTVVQLHGPVST